MAATSAGEKMDGKSESVVAGGAGSITLSGRVRSFSCAARGIGILLRTQHNAWLHMGATLLVVTAGGWLGLSAGEWCWIVLATMAVWTAEALNTALERLADAAAPAYHPLTGQAKDVAAGAVLISACGSAAVGLLVLGPRAWAWLAAL